MSSNSSVIHHYRHPILFYSVSIIIPWCFWFLAGYISYIKPYQDRYLNIASVLAFIGLLVPMMMAGLLIGRDRVLRQDVMARFFNVKAIKPCYLLLTFLIMPASIILAQAVSILFGYSAQQFTVVSEFSFSSGIFPVWFLLIIAPLIEELAWHSYGTDCLRNKFNLFNLSMIFGVLWGIWHIPLSSIRDYYQNIVMVTGWVHSVNFLVSIIPFVLIMNWLYYKTERNIFIPIIFHITAGFFNELFMTHPDSKVIQTGLLFVLSAVLLIKDKELFFQE